MNIRLGLMALTVCAALAVIPSTAMAAVDAFIWFDKVAGPSTDAAHPGAFEIKDFSFGAENPTTIGSATGVAGAGKVKFNEFTIKKTTDSASPLFRRSLARGQHFAQVKLEMRKAGGDPATYTFSDVSVSKVSWSGPGDEGPEESITFVYGQVAVAGPRGTMAPANTLSPPAANRPH